jgi:hypothetical protein
LSKERKKKIGGGTCATPVFFFFCFLLARGIIVNFKGYVKKMDRIFKELDERIYLIWEKTQGAKR